MPVQAMDRARPRASAGGRQQPIYRQSCAHGRASTVSRCQQRPVPAFGNIFPGGGRRRVTPRRNEKMALFRNCRCLVDSQSFCSSRLRIRNISQETDLCDSRWYIIFNQHTLQSESKL
uniref:Uncharacterized protein n=1 Tax=Oryza nivara TaxID=4536 RepID=A0A0E0FG28_ORYNI